MLPSRAELLLFENSKIVNNAIDICKSLQILYVLNTKKQQHGIRHKTNF